MSKDCTLAICLPNNSFLLHSNAMYDIYPLRKYYSPFRYVSSFEVVWLGEMFKWACARAENIEDIEEILSYLCLKEHQM